MNARKIVDILLEDEDFDFSGYVYAAYTPRDAYELVIKRHDLAPVLEPALAQHPVWAYRYAYYILGGKRFPAGEPVIANDPECAYLYAHNVICGGFPAGEAAIATDPDYSFYYARDDIERPFPAGEAAIATSERYSKLYNLLFGTNLGQIA